MTLWFPIHMQLSTATHIITHMHCAARSINRNTHIRPEGVAWAAMSYAGPRTSPLFGGNGVCGTRSGTEPSSTFHATPPRVHGPLSTCHNRQEIPVHALKTIVADIKKRWRDQQANDGQEVSDGSDEESDLEEYKEKEVVEEDGGFGGGGGQAGELSIDTPRPEDPQVFCASMRAMEACLPAGVVIHIVAPGGERMRCNRLALESCMILGGSWQDVGRLCVWCKTMS